VAVDDSPLEGAPQGCPHSVRRCAALTRAPRSRISGTCPSVGGVPDQARQASSFSCSHCISTSPRWARGLGSSAGRPRPDSAPR
jgi:hypothetical protein